MMMKSLMNKRMDTKKTLITLSLILVLALSLMVMQAYAATQSIQFLNADGSVSTHATSFIKDGQAEVSGSPGNYTVTITLNNTYPPFPLIPVSYDYLKADLNGAPGGDGTYEVTATKTVSGSTTIFTISGVSNLTDNIPILLYVNAGIFHNAEYMLFIDWL